MQISMYLCVCLMAHVVLIVAVAVAYVTSEVQTTYRLIAVRKVLLCSAPK